MNIFLCVIASEGSEATPHFLAWVRKENGQTKNNLLAKIL